MQLVEDYSTSQQLMLPDKSTNQIYLSSQPHKELTHIIMHYFELFRLGSSFSWFNIIFHLFFKNSVTATKVTHLFERSRPCDLWSMFISLFYTYVIFVKVSGLKIITWHNKRPMGFDAFLIWWPIIRGLVIMLLGAKMKHSPIIIID